MLGNLGLCHDVEFELCKEETSQNGGVFIAEPSFSKVDDHPEAFRDCVVKGKGALSLPDEVSNVRISKKRGDAAEKRFTDNGLHRFAERIVPCSPVVENGGIVDLTEKIATAFSVGEKKGQLK